MSNPLLSTSSDEWLKCVLENFDEFLIDHAANERKASAMALSMVAHYPDKALLLETMVDLALEELNHYRQVIKIMVGRGLIPGADEKDPYVNQIIKRIRRGTLDYFLDRLLSASIIEARGTERFQLIADNIEDSSLAKFYSTLARSEKNHHELFLRLATTYFDQQKVEARWQEWQVIERDILSGLEIRSRLH
ncbi:MAG: tRNA-(ms[2]io[6]A)-hydroxylase [Pseudomonadales bacterium]|nr:tRNA-(ms[2]io[6]A)-hydroxylase [Pseudomonadales bacterium]